MAMYQLGMLEFLEDIDRYMLELSRRNSPDSSSSFVTALSTRASSSSNIRPPLLSWYPMKSASSNESSPGGLEDILRFPFLPPTHVTTKHATLAIALAITETNVPFINAPTALAGPQAITPIVALFVAAPPSRPLILPRPPHDDHPDPLVALLFPLPLHVAPIHHTHNPGAHATGIAPPFRIKTTLTFMKTSLATESLTV